ncbi:CDP-alcohol phosphatidyltransferase family protein [Marimonas arenosa]|uniref:CDP-alcohol phosphatidyltransferase family protein n=1 Tax=Marimonas arenosa TaxID=1795305 RepID=A0AAE4B579_9RHOB|nr:CDP-alcohol phosphatidyltransferase family protein [Marimonas arenosa]MDQ2090079.1 CDP-alcohol phosphatidyltransferase family protein [Marimonas arenosa]
MPLTGRSPEFFTLVAQVAVCQGLKQWPLRHNIGEGYFIVNISDQLSFYRLAAAPVAAWVALEGHRDAFFILVAISLVTDLVDGPVARWLGQESRFGAKLDTIADACTLLAAILGLYLLEGHNMQSELPWLYLFLASYAAAAAVSMAKFGELPAYHLYLSKAAAFVAALFFVWLYLIDYSRQFFLFVVILGVLANTESLLLSLRLKRFRTDIVSLFAANALARDDDD